MSALLNTLITFKLANRQLSLALDGVGSGSPYLSENYGWWHGVIAAAIRDRPDDGDANYLAHALLAAVRSDLLEHLLSTETLTEAQIRTKVAGLAARLQI